jgi:CO/xanthine dehydrogenase Mo-binding subunit
MLTMREETLNVVGQPVLRRDGMGHVTGKTVYVDDINFPDMLYLKMVRSPVPHARIKGIDFSAAELVGHQLPEQFKQMSSWDRQEA